MKLEELIVSGSGGDGSIFLGRFIAYIAEKKNWEIKGLPSYGPESRGGKCNIQLIISEESISSPLIEHPRTLIVFNQVSLDEFGSTVNENGLVIYNNEIVKVAGKQSGVRYVGLPTKEAGIVNMAMLGAYSIFRSGIVSIEEVERYLPAFFKDLKKESLIEENMEAFYTGVVLSQNWLQENENNKI